MERLSALTGRASDQHDAPMVSEAARGCPARVEDGVEIHVHRPMPLLIVHVGERSIAGRPDSMVAHKEVQSVELRITPSEKGLDVISSRQVTLLRPGMDAQSLTRLDHLGGLGFATSKADSDGRPRTRKEDRGGSSYAP
jgi:hypothetical protein